MHFRHLSVGLAAVLALGRAHGAEPPMRPGVDAAGNFSHPADVVATVVAISPQGVTIECRRNGTGETWRERYGVKDGKLALAAVGTLRPIPARPAHDEWQETTVSESPPVPAPKEPIQLPNGTQVGGADLRGAVVDPRWGGYPDYLRRLTDAISAAWNRERIRRKLYSHPGSRVAVKFVLNARGEVARVEDVQLSPGTPDSAAQACVAAVTIGSPYPAWTENMIAVLGNEQTLSFAFYYP